MIATVCPDRQALLRYSLGMLPEHEREALDSHLDSCPDCQAMIVTLDDADDTAIARLRTPLSGDSVLSEPQLQGALAAALGMPAPDGDCPDFCRAPAQTGGENGTVPLNADESPDMPRMLGEYRLLEELGRGGMGRVYKALHTKLDRIVAVKVLPHSRAGDGNAANRFAREMKAVGRLAHPNIVQAYDAREIDGTAVLIMELVDGLDLAEIVRRAAIKARSASEREYGTHSLALRASIDSAGAQISPGHGIPVPDACELVRQTALALQCAHEHGLVHRDVKPSNIMLARSGEVKLLDLGLARFFAEDISSASQIEEMTGTGQAMGTADYMAPEQASDSRGVDIRADIYSLGCTFFKLLTGRAPFSGAEYRTTLAKMNAHAHQAAPPVRDLASAVPEALAAIVDRMLAKDPAARFATPAEVAAAVAPFCSGADLVALLKRAESSPPRHQGDADSGPPLPPGVGRGEGGSIPPQRPKPAPSPAPLPIPHRRKSLIAQLVVTLLFGGVCFALGIIITIKRNGQTYQVEAPEGSRTVVDPNGNATVEISGHGADVPASAPADHASDLKALQGLWNVVNFGTLEKCDDAVRAMADIVGFGPDGPARAWPPSTYAYRFEFRQGSPWPGDQDTSLVFYQDPRVLWPNPNRDSIENSPLYYRINPTATPRTMDILSVAAANASGKENLVASAIYDLQGDHLTIAMRKYSPSIMGDQRPRQFAAPQGSDTIVLQLERYRPAAVDKALKATWQVVQQVNDGKEVSQENLKAGRYVFGDYFVRITDPSRAENDREMSAQFVVGSAKDPNTMTILSYGWPSVIAADASYKAHDFHGIYKFDGDRLTIAYRENKPAPEKFESTPGSGVTLLVLEKAKPATAGDTAKKEQKQQDAAAALKTLRGRWKLVSVERGKMASGITTEILGFDGKRECPANLGLGYLEFDSGLDILDYTNIRNWNCKFAIDPSQNPKTIEVTQQPRDGHPSRWINPTMQGIYEIDGDQMRLCISSEVPGMKTHSPARFAAEPDSGDVLLVLQRSRPTEEETAIAGDWDVFSRTENGTSVAKSKIGGLTFRSGNFYFMHSDGQNPAETLSGTIVLDAGKKPNWITMRVTQRSPNELISRENPFGGQTQETILSGIYALEKERLTVAYSENGPRPERFESPPGSSVTILMLEKAKLDPWNLIRKDADNRVAAFIRKHYPDISDRKTTVDFEVAQLANGNFTHKVRCDLTIRGKGTKQVDLLIIFDSKGEVVSIADLNGGSGGVIPASLAAPPLPPAVRVTQPVVPSIGGTASTGVPALAGENSAPAKAGTPAPAEAGTPTAPRKVPAIRPSIEATPVYLETIGKIIEQKAANPTEPAEKLLLFDIDQRTFARMLAAAQKRYSTSVSSNWPAILRVSYGYEVADGKDFPNRGKVKSLAGHFDPNVAAVPCTATLAANDAFAAPGMSVRVRLDTGMTQENLVLPRQAIFSDQGKQFVYLVNVHNVPEKRAVETSQPASGLRIRITGLDRGDIVIADPSEVQPGIAVKLDLIAGALLMPTPPFEFAETPLKDVVVFLKDALQIEIQLDATALSKAGVDPDTQCTLQVRDVSFGSALKMLLRDLGLTYKVEDEYLLITSPDQEAKPKAEQPPEK